MALLQKGQVPIWLSRRGCNARRTIGSVQCTRLRGEKHPTERFIRTLKEQLLWVRTFATVEDLRLALLEWAHRYNEHWLLARHHFLCR